MKIGGNCSMPHFATTKLSSPDDHDEDDDGEVGGLHSRASVSRRISSSSQRSSAAASAARTRRSGASRPRKRRDRARRARESASLPPARRARRRAFDLGGQGFQLARFLVAHPGDLRLRLRRRSGLARGTPRARLALLAVFALAQIVGIAAGIFLYAAVARQHEHAVDQPVEEVAVVADQQQRAFVVVQHVLQQVERVDVEIVGRLVEHEQVARLGERARQEQAVALAAGQGADRRSSPASRRTGSRANRRRHGAGGRAPARGRRRRAPACSTSSCRDRARRGAGRNSPG